MVLSVVVGSLVSTFVVSRYWVLILAMTSWAYVYWLTHEGIKVNETFSSIGWLRLSPSLDSSYLSSMPSICLWCIVTGHFVTYLFVCLMPVLCLCALLVCLSCLCMFCVSGCVWSEFVLVPMKGILLCIYVTQKLQCGKEKRNSLQKSSTEFHKVRNYFTDDNWLRVALQTTNKCY